MDADRFDAVTRILTSAPTRRGALVTVLGGSLGLFGLANAEAKKKGKGKKKKKKKSTTLPAPTATVPPPPPDPAPTNPCAGKDDETLCGAWTICDSPRRVCGDFCSGGVCAQVPTCNGSTDPCGPECCEPAGASCTSFPNPNWCGCSSIGNQCYSSGDCCGGGVCVGFVCQWPSA